VDAEDRADTTPEDTKAQGHMVAEADRLTEVATRATEVATAAEEAAATTTTTGMMDRSSEEVVEATKETPSQASHPMATKGAHRVAATMIEVIAEAEEASTKDLQVEVNHHTQTSLQSPAPLLLPFLRIQKMPKLKSAAFSPTSSK
jgi:hypothetical protein